MSDIQKAPEPDRTTLNRVLLTAIIVMGVLIVVGIAALIYGAIAGWSKHVDTTPASPPAQTATLQSLPKDARIIDMKVDGGRTIIRLQTAKGEEVDIYDTATGQLVTRIAPQ